MSLRLTILYLGFLLCLPLLSRAAETPQTTLTGLPISNNACEFVGQFQQQKFIAALDQALPSSGQFYHHCEYGVIWSTNKPINETLVMQRKGKGFLVNDSGTEALTSRQGKFLSALLNGLMSSDNAEINRQFSINLLAENSYQLIPTKRKLKRGIKSIDLVFEAPSLRIKVVDRNSQTTEILSTQTETFEAGSVLEKAMQHCQSQLGKQPCSLLFTSRFNASKLRQDKPDQQTQLKG